MTILEQTEEHIFNLHKYTLSNSYTYHNYNHTLRVVNGINELIDNENIAPEQANLLRYAAWFHDAGYCQTNENHEIVGAQMAEDFYKQKGLEDQQIKTIKDLILATQADHQPTNLLECIIKDADFAHFSDRNYQDCSQLLRKELENITSQEISESQWHKSNHDMMLYKHRYYTQYAQRVWHPKKQINLLEIIKILDKLDNPNKKGKNEYSRTVDTLFRITLRNHTSLSSIADSKANILLSVNAIIISICLSTLIPKLDNPNNAHLIFPTFILLIFSVAAIIFAIMSTRPKVTKGTYTAEEILNRHINLLFFGSFHQMPVEQYTKNVKELIEDKEYLHEALIKDLHSLGLVLHKKYTLLRITYSIFTIGIVCSVLAFILAFRGVI